MGKPLKTLARHTIHRGKPNLLSLDDPHRVIARLLADAEVRCIIDAGASDGRVARRFGKLFTDAELHLFEPNPDYAPALASLHDEQPRYHHHALVLAESPGEPTFYVTSDPGSSSLHKPTDAMQQVYPDQSAVTERRTCTATTLDRWAADRAIERVDLIKLDIQGGEANALRGAARLLDESVRVIYTEVFFQRFYEGGATFSDIDIVLREHGFGLYSLYKPRFDKHERLLFADAIFVHAGRMGWSDAHK